MFGHVVRWLQLQVSELGMTAMNRLRFSLVVFFRTCEVISMRQICLQVFQFTRVSCFRFRFRFRALSARPPMAVPITDADRRKFLADNVSSDLQYVLEEAGVSLEAQYAIAQIIVA